MTERDVGPNLYTSNYCEENVYRLIAQRLDCLSHVDSDNSREFVTNLSEDVDKFTVIFISNANRQIPLFCQKSRSSSYVIWDYHVILMEDTGQEFIIWDYDSTLPFPCEFSKYFEKSLNDNNQYNIPDPLKRMFRFIPAKHYLRLFNNDRSHMKLENGDWSSPPPQWTAIFKTDSKSNIHDFISMDRTQLSDVSFIMKEDDDLSRGVLQRELSVIQ
ncbi:unnamed protein product [Auanema sp. JU1783]|nr:unnamed protein product [Auanema sp. JU1783]